MATFPLREAGVTLAISNNFHPLRVTLFPSLTQVGNLTTSQQRLGPAK